MSTNLDPRNVSVGAATSQQAAEPRSEAQIAADLERQRAELASTIDQLYARVQPAALAQEVKESAATRFARFKESAALTLQDAAGGNTEALRRVGIAALSTIGVIGVVAWLVTLPASRSRGQARRSAREAATLAISLLASAEDPRES